MNIVTRPCLPGILAARPAEVNDPPSRNSTSHISSIRASAFAGIRLVSRTWGRDMVEAKEAKRLCSVAVGFAEPAVVARDGRLDDAGLAKRGQRELRVAEVRVHDRRNRYERGGGDRGGRRVLALEVARDGLAHQLAQFLFGHSC